MRSLEEIFVVIMVCFGCCACNSKNEKQHTFEPVELTSPDNSDMISYNSRGTDDMVDAIYGKLIDKHPELKKVEDDIVSNEKAQADSLKQFDVYRNKSIQYYSAAMNNIRTIKDSVLKRELEKIVTQSKTNYEHRISAQTNLISDIDKAEFSLNDNHSVLKLVVTLPIIEDYQKKQMPANKKLENLLLEKQKLISRTKKLASKGD